MEGTEAQTPLVCPGMYADPEIAARRPFVVGAVR